MTLTISPRQKLAVSAARRDDIDAAPSPGKLLCYPDPQPAAGDAPSGALIASFVLTDPCGTVDAAGLHITTAAPAQVSASGIIRWGRIVDGDGNWCIDGKIRLATDADVATADYVIDTAGALVGGFVVLLSATIAEGG